MTENWVVLDDQSANDKSGLRNSDLQVSRMDEGSFVMKHKVGLVKISLGSKPGIPTLRTYSAEGTNGPDPITGMKYTDSGSTQTVNASNQFDNSSVPYNNSGYYYIVNGSKTLKSVSSTNNDWVRVLSNIAENSYQTIIIGNEDIKRTCISFVAKFDYTKSVQEFPLPVKGTVEIKCWGASGGDLTNVNSAFRGGYGGYACGSTSSIPHYKVLYVYVGQGGGLLNHNYTFNGGGGCYNTTLPQHYSGQGGGATDIRLKRHSYGDWGGLIDVVNTSTSALGTHKGDDSFDSRLIVAGGGGGANRYADSGRTGISAGGDSGGLIGYSGGVSGGSAIAYGTAPTGGTQSEGGRGGLWYDNLLDSSDGSWGFGNYGEFGGGGSGYWGGGSGADGAGVVSSGAGGSSYISGHAGCTTLTYEGITYTFSSTKMIDGRGLLWTTASQTTGGAAERMPTPGGEQEALNTGHSGNGYAIITLTAPAD